MSLSFFEVLTPFEKRKQSLKGEKLTFSKDSFNHAKSVHATSLFQHWVTLILWFTSEPLSIDGVLQKIGEVRFDA